MTKYLSTIVYLCAVIYTFMIWGFWFGVISIVFPIFPLIDLMAWLIDNHFFVNL